MSVVFVSSSVAISLKITVTMPCHFLPLGWQPVCSVGGEKDIWMWDSNAFIASATWTQSRPSVFDPMLSGHAPSWTEHPACNAWLEALIGTLMSDACEFNFPLPCPSTPLLNLCNQTDFSAVLGGSVCWVLTSRASGSACCQAMAHTTVACSSIGLAGRSGWWFCVQFRIQGSGSPIHEFFQAGFSSLCP